jgi:integrative and conjugative element protein (TIGR02256 family)
VSADDHWFYRPIRRVHRNEVQLPDYVVTRLRTMAEAAHPRETGGLLLGWWEGMMPIVADVIEVPDPRATRTRWTRHEQSAASALEAALTSPRDPNLGYVGEWHSHPADLGPSSRDISELRSISRQYPNALVLAVVRYRGSVESRLARAGRLTTPGRLGAQPTLTGTVLVNETGDRHDL